MTVTITRGQPTLALNFGQYKGCYKRPAGAQHWILAPWKNASLSGNPEINQAILDPLFSGIELTTDWKSLESSFGVYTLDWIGRQLDFLQGIGKQAILRIFVKEYSGAYTDVAGMTPTMHCLPAYITSDPATYGGEAQRGGLYRVCLGNPVGWGATLEQPYVRERLKALLNEIAKRYGTHPALKGISAPDESVRSAWNAQTGGMPPGVDATSVAAANRDIYAYIAGVFGAAKSFPIINGVDGYDPLFTTIQNTLNLQSWAVGSGMNLGFSDTFVDADWHVQPSYFGLPRLDMAPGRQILGHVDLMSLGADDATLPDRMLGMARQNYWLMGGATGNPGIIAWNIHPTSANGSPNYLAAQRYAIQATL